MKKFELAQTVSKSALALIAKPECLDKAINPNVDKIVSHKIADLATIDFAAAAALRAESYHQDFIRHSASRRKEIENSFKQLGCPQELIVMICCKNHFPFLKIWLEYCDKNNIEVRDKSLVFTLDEDASRQTKQLGLESYHLEQANYATGGQSNKFGDREFSGAVYYKNAVIHDCLSLDTNLLFQDVDLIWFKDPLPLLRENDKKADIQIMYDGPNPWHFPIYANSGFIFIRNNEATKAVFETALFNSANIFHCGGHQAPLNRILNHFIVHNVLSLKVLDETLYLNGHLFNLSRGIHERAKDWEHEGIVMHYSWTADVAQKIAKLEKFGLI